MWGNRLGWGISLVLALVIGGMTYLLTSGMTEIAPPTALGKEAQNLAPIELPIAPPTLLATMADDCDAGPLYRQAIELYEKDSLAYDSYAATGTLNPAAVSKLHAIELIVEGTKCGKSNLFASNPSEIVNFANQKPPLDALVKLGNICIDRLGLLHQRAGHTEDAMKYFQAGFALGAKLYQERLTLAEMEAGIGLMNKSMTAMANMLEKSGDSAKADELRRFNVSRLDHVKQRINPLSRALRTIDPKIVSQHAGDTFVIAQHGRERVWRVEAILALGRLKYFTGNPPRPASQRAALPLLKKLAEEEKDPVVKAAAIAARDLTVEQHRMQ